MLTKKLLSKIEALKIAIIGDMILDEYIYGQTSRVSREAPVLVVRHERAEYRPGGAANAVANVAAWHTTVYPLGYIGNDEGGRHLKELFTAMGCRPDGLVECQNRPTAVKSRILAGAFGTMRQQVLRLDREPDNAPSAAQQAKLLKKLDEISRVCDLLIVSDYGSQTVSKAVIDKIRALAAAGLPVYVDSRYNLGAFSGVKAVTPNTPEAEAFCGKPAETAAAVSIAGEYILDSLQLKMALVTRGSQGMALFEPGKKPFLIPADGSTEVTDVTGAGDTVIALFAMGIEAGMSPKEAMKLANKGAGIVVTRMGAATVDPQQLLEDKNA